MNSQIQAEPHAPRHVHLESLIQMRLGSRVRDLRIRLEPAGIVLQGRSATYHAKQLATHAAMELGEVRILANEIVVL